LDISLLIMALMFGLAMFVEHAGVKAIQLWLFMIRWIYSVKFNFVQIGIHRMCTAPCALTTRLTA
jgi:hypothetical protein